MFGWWERNKNQTPDSGAETIVFDAVTLPPGTQSDTALQGNAGTQVPNAKQETESMTITSSQQELLTATSAAGVHSAADFASVKAKADGFDAKIKEQRTGAKALLVALYSDPTELKAEQDTVDSLPAGPVLDRYCNKIAKDHDAKLGVTEFRGSNRQTEGAVASPAKIAQQLSTEEVAKMDAEIDEMFKGQGVK